MNNQNVSSDLSKINKKVSTSKVHDVTSLPNYVNSPLKRETTKSGVYPECPVGNTGVASMWKSAVGPKISTRAAENLVLTVTKRSCLGLGASASIVQIVESLVWPFVTRQSEKDVWFSDKELNRFVHSIRSSAKKLIQIQSEDNREQTFCKFWLDSLMCQLFKDPQRPVKETWMTVPLFGGWCKRFIARRIARKDLSFIYSLAKGSKKAWAELGEVKKAAALKKHAGLFSRPHEPLTKDAEEMIQFTASEIFKSLGPATKFMPSGSACLQASRRNGGTLSLVSRFNLPLSTPEASLIGKLPVLNAELNRWRNEEFRQLEEHAASRVTVPDRTGHMPGLELEVMAIPEPGKYRILTKMDGYLCTALQPLQGKLLSAWKRSAASTMLTNDLSERVKQIDANVKLPFLCSVDYESATDLQKRAATIACLSTLSDDKQYELAMWSFSSGLARYPDGTVIEAGEGQPMGHPLSFPFLCIINLAVYRMALERWANLDRRGKVSWGSSFRTRMQVLDICWDQVLVNGDDMLFKCDKELYDIFMVCASEVGFKISQGKNYLSEDACMINSQVFMRTAGVLRRRGYLNLKLIKGISLKEGDSSATPTQISASLNEMVKLCSWTNCAVPAAMGRWKKDWFGPIYRPNWYLPVHLGGFGLDRQNAPSTFRITKSQREMAARFVSDPRMALYRRKGMTIPTVELSGALANWRVVVGDYVPTKNESDDNSDEWLARLAYSARAHHGSKEVSDKIFIAKFKPQYRLKPMSIEGINLYWNARLYASDLPPCPPIGLIKIRPFLDIPSAYDSSYSFSTPTYVRAPKPEPLKRVTLVPRVRTSNEALMHFPSDNYVDRLEPIDERVEDDYILLPSNEFVGIPNDQIQQSSSLCLLS